MNRRKGLPVGMSQVLGGLLDRAGMGHLLYEDKLRRRWAELLGPRAAEMASLEGLKGWVLRLKVESATWRMELSYQRETIRKRANELLGAEVVKDVVLN